MTQSINETLRRQTRPDEATSGPDREVTADGAADGSAIADWFSGRSVLITGATGFMGKVLLEKLLRSCPGIARVFVLVRPKRGLDAHQRLDQLLHEPLFDALRRRRPDALARVMPVAGDLIDAGLGVDATQRRVLTDAVSVVFHVAATVKFDEMIKHSVEKNVEGTRRIVELCREMANLKALVHVSTAFANCPQTEISERVYPPHADPGSVVQGVRWMDDALLEDITPRLLGAWPNTYTYTKALAEHLVMMHAENLPVAILRPSVVTAAWREPVPGWVDNLNGATGVLAGLGKGVIHTQLCDKRLVADFVPVDIVINMLISVAWCTAVSPRPPDIPVYNCTTGADNPLHYSDLETLCVEFARKNPFSDVAWYPCGTFKTSRAANVLCQACTQVAPAYALDAYARLTGQKPFMVRLQQKTLRALSVIEYFMTHEWRFESSASRRLALAMAPADRALFPFDVADVQWRAYFEQYMLGIRRYVFREDPETLPAARQQLWKMYLLHVAVQAAPVLLLLWWLLF